MATNNVINDAAPSLTVTGGLTVTSGNTTLTPIESTAATGVVTINSSGVLSHVETGVQGTVFIGSSTSPKFLAVGTSGARLVSQGSGFDPQWLSGYGLTQYAVVVGSSSGSITSLPAGTTGQCLMGNTGANPSVTGSPSYSGTLTASSGNITITSGNLALPSTTASVGWIKGVTSDTTYPFAYAYGVSNLNLGDQAGNTGTVNTATITNCIFVGYSSGSTASTSDSNITCIGVGAASGFSGGVSHWTVFGEGASIAGVGAYGTAVGYLAGGSYPYSTSFGERSSTAYNSTSSIFIFAGEYIGSPSNHNPNLLFIGDTTGNGSPGQINATYISGIQTIGITGTAVKVSTSDQLGVASSSEKFKENIQNLSGNNDKIMQLRPVSFTYKQDESQHQQYGLIAEEVAEIYPELICYASDGSSFSVHYDKLPVILLQEIQQLNKRTDALEFKRGR
jgi:hypothetical protein